MRRFFFGLAVFALAAPMPLLAETTDRQIAQQIVKQLKCQKESGELKGFNLDLEVENGAVFLKGFVSEREQRRKAVEVAQRVEGVKQVFNEIEIKSADSIAPQAAKPTVKPAKLTLVKAPEPPQVTIEPIDAQTASEGREVNDADTEPLVQAAPVNVFRNAKALLPKQETLNRPVGTSQPSARQITEAIVDEFRAAMGRGELKGFGIDVQVDQGIVTLKGSVADQSQLDYAIEVARNTQGVTKVVDSLKFVPTTGELDLEQTAGDLQLAQTASDLAFNAAGHNATFASHDGADEGVQHAYRQESSSSANDGEAERIAKAVVAGLQQQKQAGLLTNFGIDVQVDQRIVRMSGYVKDAEQHARALDVARYVPGVAVVVNDLKVQSQGVRPVNATLPQAQPLQSAAGQPMQNYQMVPIQYMPVQANQAMTQTPLAFAPARPVNHTMMQPGQPVPMTGNAGVGIAPARYDHPQMPGYAWPSYAPSPNYGAVTYPKQYSPSAWPYIGPFYPYPQVPLGWRRVTLEWDDGWWNLKFKNTRMH